MSLMRRISWKLGWVAGIIVLTACAVSSNPAVTSSGTGVATSSVTQLSITPTAPETPTDHQPPPPITTPSPTPGTVARTITFGEPLSAEYVPGALREVYMFESARVRRVGLEITPADDLGDVMLRARLYDAVGELISQQITPGDNPLWVGVWNIPSAGRYTLQLFGPEISIREVTLTLISLTIPQPGGGDIAYGETRSGEIAVAGQRDMWTFTGQAGDQVQVTLLTPYADGVVSLVSPLGEVLGLSDGSSTPGQPPAFMVTLPSEGQYTVRVRLFGDSQTGTYQLAVQLIT